MNSNKNVCPECGAPYPINAKVCPECGTKLEEAAACADANSGVCPECGSPVSEYARVCPECGSELAKMSNTIPDGACKCPECGTIHSDNDAKCPECGYSKNPIKPAPETPKPQPAVQYDEEEEQSFFEKNKIVIIIAAVVVLILAGVGVAVIINNSNNNNAVYIDQYNPGGDNSSPEDPEGGATETSPSSGISSVNLESGSSIVVLADRMRLRSSTTTSTSNNIIATISRGTVLTILEKPSSSSEWIYVSVSGYSGYVNKAFVVTPSDYNIFKSKVSLAQMTKIDTPIRRAVIDFMKRQKRPEDVVYYSVSNTEKYTNGTTCAYILMTRENIYIDVKYNIDKYGNCNLIYANSRE